VIFNKSPNNGEIYGNFEEVFTAERGFFIAVGFITTRVNL
jgi:hypothetical protein